MKYHGILYLLVFSAAVSCTEAVMEEPRTNDAPDQEVLESGYTQEIEIKLSEDMAADVEKAVSEGSLKTRSQDFNTLIGQLGITSIDRVFTEDERFLERQHRAGLHLWYRVKIDPSAAPVTRAAAALEKIPGISEAYPCPRIKPMEFNDPRFSSQWALYQPSGIDINVQPVWENYTCGSDRVTVSVTDGGVTAQEDLNVIPGGYGGSYNFVSGSYTITPDDHGIHVAGVIGAISNNGIGISGIAGGNAAEGTTGVRILSAQIFAGEDGANNSRIAEAIRYGADNGAIISQNSWGNVFDMDEDGVISGEELEIASNATIDGAMKAAIDYFIEYAGCDNDGNQLPDSPMKGGVVIFAAGNDNIPYGVPASYEKVIAVGAISSNGRKSSFSNYGDWVDICAPGSNIMSTISGGYAYMDGTSMACPQVSGVAALIASYFGGPGFTNEMLKERLLGGADSSINTYGNIGPLVDALGAFTYGGTIPPERVESYEAVGAGGRIDFEWTVTRDEDDAKAYGYLLLASEDRGLLENIDLKDIPEDVHQVNVTVGDRQPGDEMTGSISGLEFSTEYNVCIFGYDYMNNFSEQSEIRSVVTKANGAPVITPAESGQIDVRPFETVRRTYSIYDPDNHEISISFSSGSSAASFNRTGEGAYELVIVGNQAEAGTYEALIEVTDAFGAETSETVDYRILENRAPEVIGQAEGIMLPGRGAEATLDLNTLIHDPDEERLTWTVSNSNQAAVHTNTSGNTLYMTALGFGNADITVTGSDARGESAKVSFTVLVKDPESPLDIFPNPVTDYLNVRTMNEMDTRITIITSTGSEVYDRTSSVGAFTPAVIDMSGYAPGRYTVKVSFGGEEYVRTVVKL